MQTKTIKIKKLKTAKYNPRKISKKDMDALVSSIKKYGLVQPIVVNKNNVIIGGHQRVEACRKLKYTEVPVMVVDLDEESEKELNIILNKVGGTWDEEKLTTILQELAAKNRLAYTGFTQKELDKLQFKQGNTINRKLIEDFIVPPFSVFDTRQGYWQERKKEWVQFLGRGAEGRETELLGESLGRLASMKSNEALTGTSLFDPVLTEVIYTWYVDKGGLIIDPFAGSYVRGLVASTLGYNYIGTDVSKKQVEENRKKAKQLEESNAKWEVISGEKLGTVVGKETADLVFTCPPYYDLEIYDPENPEDISAAGTYEEFIKCYTKVLHNTYHLLGRGKWAIIVVGNVRDKNGNYYNLVGDTIQIMQDAGYHFYNEVILATAIGTATLRARKTFSKSKKVVKTHQNVLFFTKGKEIAINKALQEVLLEGRTATAHKDVLVFKK